MITKVRPKADAYIADLAREFGQPDNRKEARELLTAVLHAIRDNVPLDNAMNILIQLPPFLKEIYSEDWKPSLSPSYIQENLDILQEVLKRTSNAAKPKNYELLLRNRITVIINKLSNTISWNPPDFLQKLIPDKHYTKEYLLNRKLS